MTLFRDCSRCKRLMKDGTCRGTADWWPLREIWLCRMQVLFLIEQLLPLELGKYPDNPYTSGYTEAPKTSFRIGAAAPFESVLSVRAELNHRLAQTGIAGKWLIDNVQSGKSLSEIWEEPRQALHYISGWKRKSMPFSKWLWTQENRVKRGCFIH